MRETNHSVLAMIVIYFILLRLQVIFLLLHALSKYFDVYDLIHVYYRIRNCLTQLYAKDITPDEKQELDEALQREVCIKGVGFVMVISYTLYLILFFLRLVIFCLLF